MQGQRTFNIVQTIVNVVFYVGAMLALLVVILKTMALVKGPDAYQPGSRSGLNFHFDVKLFERAPDPPVFIHGTHTNTVLEQKHDEYTLHTTSRTPLSYLSYVLTLLGAVAVVLGLDWLKKIFRDTSASEPFRMVNAYRIRNIGLLFIISDIVRMVGYYIFNLMAGPLFKVHFQQLVDIGNGYWMGFLLLALAIVYKRGVEIYQENQLTI